MAAKSGKKSIAKRPVKRVKVKDLSAGEFLQDLDFIFGL